MRIPVNSCLGCNKDEKMTLSGHHCMGGGKYIRCAFVTAEMADWPNTKLLFVFSSRARAIRAAVRNNAAILWSGQAPKEMWLVVKDKGTENE